MAVKWTGKEVAFALKEASMQTIQNLKENGVVPKLAVIRVGNQPEDLAYERGIMKRFESAGAAVEIFELPEDANTEQVISTVHGRNNDPQIHGILIFRPLPKHIDEAAVLQEIDPKKDVDCVTESNLAKIFIGDESGFAPCTAEACIQLLDYYGYDCTGVDAVIIGRSTVIGKPVAMMLLKKHATVTILHTRTKMLYKKIANARLVIAAAGHQNTVTKDCCSPDQVMLDVGINVDENGKLCGDIDYAAAECIVKAITPVPGGVGSVTTAVLLSHVVRAAKETLN